MEGAVSREGLEMSVNNEKGCPICCGPADVWQQPGGYVFVRCVRCGEYEMSFPFYLGMNQGDWRQQNQRLLAGLSAHTRQTFERGERATVLVENWESGARGHVHTSIETKLTLLLEYLARKTSLPGERVTADWNNEWPLFDVTSPQEIPFFLEALEARKDLFRDGERWMITVDGWTRLQPTQPGGVPGTCFIAMAFDSSLEEAYLTGIRPAIQDCGLREVRVDKVEHNGIVTDLILAEIRGAQLLIADVTLQRNGVYFEAGFAAGLGRTVVWSCRTDDMKNVHFDTRQYSHVVWATPEELREKLRNRIRATVRI
jgi:hypothetical protein